LKKTARISNLSDNNQQIRNVLIVAGEASGDLHGSNLVKVMQELDPRIRFFGIGGEKMAEAGVEILVPASRLSVVGISEVLAKSFSIAGARFKLYSLLKKKAPDLLILIDYPGFNLRLAQKAKEHGLKVLYYISPQIWAWKRGRLKKISKVVDRMAVILPFEKEFYRDSGLQVEYVGHPVMDHIPLESTLTDRVIDVQPQAVSPIIGILPGSRTQEIKRLLPVMIKALEIVSTRFPDMKIILPMSPVLHDDLVEFVSRFLKDCSLKISIIRQDLHQALKGCDLAIVTSGTATLETAIMEIPMIIVYRVSLLTSWIGKMVIKVPYIGLVNLVAEKQVVPEFVQTEVTPSKLADEMLSILQSSQRKTAMTRDLKMVKEKLGGPGASRRTAGIALDMIYDT
jgi:lipid-A-disaccharide synthase